MARSGSIGPSAAVLAAIALASVYLTFLIFGGFGAISILWHGIVWATVGVLVHVGAATSVRSPSARYSLGLFCGLLLFCAFFPQIQRPNLPLAVVSTATLLNVMPFFAAFFRYYPPDPHRTLKVNGEETP